MMRTIVNLPKDKGDLDEGLMEEVIANTSYWDFIQPKIKNRNKSLLTGRKEEFGVTPSCD